MKTTSYRLGSILLPICIFMNINSCSKKKSSIDREQKTQTPQTEPKPEVLPEIAQGKTELPKKTTPSTDEVPTNPETDKPYVEVEDKELIGKWYMHDRRSYYGQIKKHLTFKDQIIQASTIRINFSGKTSEPSNTENKYITIHGKDKRLQMGETFCLYQIKILKSPEFKVLELHCSPHKNKYPIDFYHPEVYLYVPDQYSLYEIFEINHSSNYNFGNWRDKYLNEIDNSKLPFPADKTIDFFVLQFGLFQPDIENHVNYSLVTPSGKEIQLLAPGKREYFSKYLFNSFSTPALQDLKNENFKGKWHFKTKGVDSFESNGLILTPQLTLFLKNQES